MLPIPAPEPSAAQETGGESRQIDFADGGTGRVSVSKTEDLRNEAVRIEWSGFLPSTASQDVPVGLGNRVNDLHFPVVVFQCHHAAGEAPVREQCMTEERRIPPKLDLAEPQAAPEPLSLNVPFVDVYGRSYEIFPGSQDYPDDWRTFGKANQVAMTAQDGTGAMDFQVRTGDESPISLGCGRSPAQGEPVTECSLVVVPVREMDCDQTLSPSERLTCIEAPTNTNLARSRNLDVALSGSNWRNRVVFPLTFAPEEGYCELTDAERLPTAGSELAAEAMYSWIPAMCGAENGTPVAYSPSGESLARAQYLGGGHDFTLGSRPVEGADRPTVHAPMAVSGFGIAFMIDDAESKQVTEMNLNARLVAKLLTQSYRGNFCNDGQRWLCDFLPNQPTDLLADDEFQELNPHIDLDAGHGVDGDDGAPMATLVLPSGVGDVPEAVTRWILADPDAAAFLAGEKDPWGMRVNPVFTDWQLPVEAFEWRDDWSIAPDDPAVPQPYDPVGLRCGDAGPSVGSCPYVGEILHDLLAQSSTNLREIGARTIVNAHPLQETAVDEVGSSAFSDRSAPQVVGKRSIIGLVDLATAERYRLPLANLSTGGTAADGAPVFASPTETAMFRAVQSGTLDDTSGTIQLDYDELAQTGGYPGTMLVYGAAPTTGLDETTADGYANLLEYAAGPGQVYGLAQGWLPPGYLALPPELAQQTLAAAQAVREQDGTEVVLPPIDDPGELTPPGGDGTTGGGNGDVPPGGTGGEVPA
ncbi:hypothetical protein, partial [Glycomyces tenuis]|uniref:hypothetical protein n=1 Tax=Glycomyces tenuis TaxID=58116 RepID=UPI00138E32EB